MKRRGDAEGLVRALAYEDVITDRRGHVVDLGVPVRERAVSALIELDARVMREDLTRALEDPDEQVRNAAQRGLENAQIVHDGLLRALQDPEDSVRILAIDGLRTHEGSVAREPLVHAVTTWTQPEHQNARHTALDALAAEADADILRRTSAALLLQPDELADADATVLRRLAQAAGEDARRDTITHLVGDLRHESAAARARKLLIWLAPDSTEPLIAALTYGQARYDAALALGAIRDSRAVEPLCLVLQSDEDPAVRKAAAWALGEVMDPRAVETLLVALGDRDYDVRVEASKSFDKLGNAAIAVALRGDVRRALDNGATAGGRRLPPVRPDRPMLRGQEQTT